MADRHGTAVIDEVERRYNAAMRRPKQSAPDHGLRAVQLQTEIDNLIQAIATGALHSSPAIATRLQSAEAELARLQAAQKPVNRPAIIVPNVRGRFLAMVGRLDQVLLMNPERGRDELRGILAERIKLQPDVSGRFLWADYSLGLVPLVAGGTNADLMVAGAGFEPATFGL